MRTIISTLTMVLLGSVLLKNSLAQDISPQDFKIESRISLSLTPDKKEELFDKLQQQKNILVKEDNDLASQKLSRQSKAEKRSAILDSTNAISLTQGWLKGESITEPEELRQVEEVVRWFSRPVWVVCEGIPWVKSDQRERFYENLNPHLPAIFKTANSTGLITSYDNRNGILRKRSELGTAVVVGGDKVITNKHVLVDGGIAYKDTVDDKWKIFSRISAKIEFPYEYPRCADGRVTPKEVIIREVAYVDPILDVAILTTDGELPPPVKFNEENNLVEGDRVVVIGYPSRPGDNDTFLSPKQIDSVFSSPDGRTPFPAERISSGAVIREQGIEDGYFAYDATTWGGNSGSVVISLVTGGVVGLHARGLQAPTQGLGYNEGVLSNGINKIITNNSLNLNH